MTRLNTAAVQVANSSEVRERFANQRAEVLGSPPAEHAACTQAEVAKRIKVTRQADWRSE